VIELIAGGRRVRRGILCAALAGFALLPLIAGGALLARADEATEVRIDNFKFAPGVLRVKKGEEVRWVTSVDCTPS
jgi:plastocyanin